MSSYYGRQTGQQQRSLYDQASSTYGTSTQALGQMADQISALRQAIRLLHNGDRQADAWLVSFRASAGAWQLCLRLLSLNDCGQEELWFAANTLRTSFSRFQDALEAPTLQQLLPQMAQLLLAATSASNWPVVSQLSGAIAALSVRAPGWDPALLLLDLQALLKARPSLAAQQQLVAAQQHVQQLQSLIPAGDHLALQLQIQQLQRQQEQDAAAQGALLQLTALLHIMAALPDAISSRQTAVHPARRTAVAAAMRAQPAAAALCHTALGAGGRQLELLALKVLQEWCALGAPPAGLLQLPALTQCVSAAVLLPETAVAAGECLVALLQACGAPLPAPPPPPPADPSLVDPMVPPPAVVPVTTGSPPLGVFVHPALMVAILDHWLEAAVRRPVDGAGGGGAGGAALALLSPHMLLPVEVQVARCSVLCAAGAALLPLVLPMSPALGGPEGAGRLASAGGAEAHLADLLRRVVDEVLDCISCFATDVSLRALEWFQGTYLTALLAAISAPPAVGDGPGLLARPPPVAELVSAQRGVLERLAGAIMTRMQLMPDQAAVATADARDLQEDVRTVRRELASVLRDLTLLVGNSAMLQYIAASVRRELQALDVAAAAAAASGDGGVGRPAAWPPLESCIYAANVVVGRMSGDALAGDGAGAALQQLLEVAAASIMHGQGSPKLAGSALTLLGNLPHWYCRAPGALPGLLAALEPALRSPDERLARNAATNLHKLVGHVPLARLLLRDHPTWVEAMLRLLNERGGVLAKASPGDDLSMEEFLMASLCRISAASPQVPASARLLLALARPKAEQVRGHLLELLQLHRQAPAPAPLPYQLQQSQLQGLPLAQQIQMMMQYAGTAGGGGGEMKGQVGAQHFGGGAQGQQQQGGIILGQGMGAASRLGSPAARVAQCLEVLIVIVESSVSPSITHNGAVPGGRAAAKAAAKAAAAAAAAAAVLDQDDKDDDLDNNGEDDEGGGPSGAATPQTRTTMDGQRSGVAAAAAAAAPAADPCDSMHLLELIGCVWEILDQCLHTAAHLQQTRAQQQQLQQGQGTPQQLWQQQQQLQQQQRGGLSLTAHDLDAAAAAATVGSSTCSFLRACLAAVSPDQVGGFSLLQGCATLMQALPPGLLAAPAALALLAACVRSVATAPDAWAGRARPRLAELVATATASVCPLILAGAAAAAVTSRPGGGYGQGSAARGGQGPPHGGGYHHHHQGGGGGGHHHHHHSSRSDGSEVSAGLALALFGLASACATALPEAFVAADAAAATAAAAAGLTLLGEPPAPSTSVLDNLLAVTVACCRSSQLELCRALLDWVSGLATVTYSEVKGAGRTVARAAARAWLEAGAGTRLVLALLLAAGGDMPPDLVLPISACVHAVWRAAGDERFRPWLEAATGVMTPPRAPWARLRPDARAAFVAELIHPGCAADVPRFKRALKSFCGGKKKGGGGRNGGGPAGGGYGPR